MIATLFLATGISGTALIAAAVLSGNPARQFVLTRGQEADELRKARHELNGAGVYIGQLQADLVATSRTVETVRGDRDLQIAYRKRDAQRIKELEEQLVTFESMCIENKAIRAALANTYTHTQLGVEETGESAIPGAYDDFINATAAEWAATKDAA